MPYGPTSRPIKDILSIFACQTDPYITGEILVPECHDTLRVARTAIWRCSSLKKTAMNDDIIYRFEALAQDADSTVTPFVLRVARPRFDRPRGHYFRIDRPYFRRKWY